MSEQPNNRQTVRAVALNRALAAMDESIRNKTAALLERYHLLHVAPLEQRIAEMERWSAGYWIRRAWAAQRRWYTEPDL